MNSLQNIEKLSSLSIVLPAFNEEANIELAVEKALEAAERVAETYEIIVVDDGSSDGTAELVTAMLGAQKSQLRLIRHVGNRGYGAAVRTGLSHAHHDYVFYTDADNQFDPMEIEYLLPLIRANDVVVGFRVYRYDSAYRVAASWGYNLLVRVLFRVPIRDVDCAFKLFRREVVDRITVEVDDFFVDTELIARARKWNFKIAEKGVRHYPRQAGETTVLAGDIPRTLRTVFRMWQRIHFPTRRQIGELDQVKELIDELAVEVDPAPR